MSHCVWGQRGVQGSARDLLYPSSSSVLNQSDAYAPTSTSAASAAAAATPQVLCMSWNDDGSCLAVGTVDGFKLYSTEYISGTVGASALHNHGPSYRRQQQHDGDDGTSHHRLVEVASRTIRGGVRHIALHEQGSILLFSGASPATENIVVLWDDAAVDQCGTGTPQAVQVNNTPRSDVASTAAAAAAAVVDDDTGPLFRRIATDNDVYTSCVIGKLEMTAPVAALRLHERLVVVAEPFRVHLYDTYLNHVDTFLTPNHGRRSTAFSDKGDFGLVWDNGAQSIAVAAVAPQETPHSGTGGTSHSARGATTTGSSVGTTLPVVRLLTLGPDVGSVRCIQFFAGGGGGVGGPTSTPTSSTSRITTPVVGRTPTSLGASQPPPLPAVRGWVESKLVAPSPHSHKVQCVAISPDGLLGLSCSVQGTAIKLIDTRRGVVTRQFTRGITTSVIGCLALSVDGRLAACIGKSGTVHVFLCSGGGATTPPPATQSQSNTSSHSTTAVSNSSGGSFSWMKSVLQSVAAVGSMDSLQAYLGSDYAITTFNLNIANADSDGLRLRASLSPADTSGGAGAGAAAAAATSQQPQKHPRSAVSEAFLLQDEDNLQRVLDVSEHSGFDPLFTALQFRPGFHNLPRSSTSGSGGGGGHVSSASAAAAAAAASSQCYANLFLACGNVTPDGYGLKSKCIQVAVPLPSSLIFTSSTSPAATSAAGGGGHHHAHVVEGSPSLDAPFVTHTSLFPKDSL